LGPENRKVVEGAQPPKLRKPRRRIPLPRNPVEWGCLFFCLLLSAFFALTATAFVGVMLRLIGWAFR
jgi:hypothetical protein